MTSPHTTAPPFGQGALPARCDDAMDTVNAIPNPLSVFVVHATANNTTRHPLRVCPTYAHTQRTHSAQAHTHSPWEPRTTQRLLGSSSCRNSDRDVVTLCCRDPVPQDTSCEWSSVLESVCRSFTADPHVTAEWVASRAATASSTVAIPTTTITIHTGEGMVNVAGPRRG